MGKIHPSQRKKAIRLFEECRDGYRWLYNRMKGRKPRSFTDLKEIQEIRERILKIGAAAIEVTEYLFNIASDEPPFIFYTGESLGALNHAPLTSDPHTLNDFFGIMRRVFDDDGKFLGYDFHRKGAEQGIRELRSVMEQRGIDTKLLDAFNEYFQKCLKVGGAVPFTGAGAERDIYGDLQVFLNKNYEELYEKYYHKALYNAYLASVLLEKHSVYPRLLAIVNTNMHIFDTFVQLAKGEIATEVFNAAEVAREVLKRRQEIAHHERAKIKTELDDVYVKFNRACLYWMMMRYLSNAEWATVPIGRPRIEVWLRKEGEKAVLSVRDNGVGPDKLADVERVNRKGFPVKRGKGKKTYQAMHKLRMISAAETELKRKGDWTVASLFLPAAEAAA